MYGYFKEENCTQDEVDMFMKKNFMRHSESLFIAVQN